MQVTGCGISGATVVAQIDCLCKVACSCFSGGKQTAFTSVFNAIATTNSTKVAYVKAMKAAYEVVRAAPKSNQLRYVWHRFTLTTVASWCLECQQN